MAERARGQYTPVVLYDMTAPPGITGPGVFDSSNPMDGPSVVGFGLGGAVYWSPSNAPVNLEPTDLFGFNTSTACGISGNQQVGYGGGPATGLTQNGGYQHALLWSGTADTAVDLHPTNLTGFVGSAAYGTSGNQQVGMAQIDGSTFHAMLWSGTAGSAVDLEPGITGTSNESLAYATDGTQQGGYVTLRGTKYAYVWSGTAASGVDLSTNQFSQSAVYGVGGGQQVGYQSVNTTPQRHAMLWSGTSQSAVDLHPSSFYDSAAFGTNGTYQVGYASIQAPEDIPQAMIWAGTAASAVNLGALLPSSTIYSSTAYSLDAAGDVFGVATDKSGLDHVVEWLAPGHAAAVAVPGGSNQTATAPGRTPTSGDVKVSFASTAGGTFSNTNALSTSSAVSLRTAPLNFALPTQAGLVETWDLSYTGSFIGPATLTFHYDPSQFTPGFDPSQLQIEHFTGGQWVALLGTVDPSADTVTVTTDSFSPFALGATPEPSTFSLLVLSSGLVLVRSRCRGAAGRA